MENNEKSRYCPLCNVTTLLENETYCPDCIKILNKMYPEGWENLSREFIEEDFRCNADMYVEYDDAGETRSAEELYDPEGAREKKLITSIVILALGVLFFLLVIFWLTDWGKYWLTGKNVKFTLVDTVTNTNDGEYEVTEYYEGTAKGETIFYKCYVTYSSPDSPGYSTSELDSKGRMKMYKDTYGNWLPAKRMDIGDLLLCSLIPFALIAYGAYSLSQILKKKKE